MKAEDVVTYDYPEDLYTEVVPGSSKGERRALAGEDVVDVRRPHRRRRTRSLGRGTVIRYSFHPLDDVPFIADAETIHTLGSIASLVRSGKHVAVNCMSGVNRSGLLVGRALVELGYTPEEATRRCAAPEVRWLQQQALRPLPPGRLHPSRPGTTPSAVTAALIP